MNYTDLQKPVSQDVSYGALLGLLLATAFVVVIPALKAMQEMPLAYYYSMPVADSGDNDADGVPNFADGTPNGARAVIIEEIETEEALEGDFVAASEEVEA